MPESIKPTNTKTTLASDIKTAVGFSAAPTGFGAITSVAKNRGIKGAIDSLAMKEFKALNNTLKSCDKDVFTRASALSESYDTYKSVLKKANKLSKKAARAAKNGDVSFVQKILNFFSKEKVTVNSLDDAAKVAQSQLDEAKTLLKDGKAITQELTKGAEKIVAAEVATSTKESVGKIFKSELGNKFVLGITLLGAVPRIKDEVIPAFKEKGFIEGIKTTGRVIARTTVDFVSNAGFSAIGRTIGMTVGSIFPGVGNFVGGMVGDAVGSCISMRLTNKLFDKNNENNEVGEENKDNIEQEPTPEATKQSSIEALINEESLTGNKDLDERIALAMTI